MIPGTDLVLSALSEHRAAFAAVAFGAGASVAAVAAFVAERAGRRFGWDGDEPGDWGSPPGCDACGAALPIGALVPVAGRWLGGPCKSCGRRAPMGYAVAEAAAGGLSAGAVLWLGGAALPVLVIGWACLLASWIDAREAILPEFVTVPLFWAGLLLSPLDTDIGSRVFGAFLCFALAWCAFKALSLRRGVDAVSGGDLMLLSAGGAWLGLGASTAFLFISAVVYAVFCTAQRNFREWVPMGPAIAAAATACAAMSAAFPGGLALGFGSLQ
jgi:leader peptidase (prepilin peptidase)/N-methyltransferase